MNNNIIELRHPMGGVMWKGKGIKTGYSAMQAFVEKYPHFGWTLSIFDTITGYTVEIECYNLTEMPKIVSRIRKLERAESIMFIGENSLSESYVVGMPCTRGRLNVPGIYKVKNGKLIDLARANPEISRGLSECEKHLTEFDEIMLATQFGIEPKEN